MKKSLYACCSFLFLISLSTKINAQELVKPVKTVAQKQMEVRNTPDNQSPTTATETPATVNSTKVEAEGGTLPKGNKPGENPENATRDNSDYQAKKQEWIKNNPEKYKAKSGNPNLQILTEEEFNALPADQQETIRTDEENYIIIR